MEEWSEYLDRGSRLNIIYLDFQKAFDSVPHERLLMKLANFQLLVEYSKAACLHQSSLYAS
jgi:hypothetical protein